MRGKNKPPPQRNACVMRLKIDVMVAAPTRKDCEESISFRGEHHLDSWEFILIRGEDGWINPSYRVSDDGKTIHVENKRKRKAVA